MEQSDKKPKTLHSKRSFGKHPRIVDYPSYDASEEDNDPLTDDGASAISVPTRTSPNAANSSSNRTMLTPHLKPRPKHQLASSFLSDSDGVDSPTYDGDVESSATAGPDNIHPHVPRFAHHHTSSSVSTLNTPGVVMEQRALQPDTNQPVFIGKQQPTPIASTDEPPVPLATQGNLDPASLTQDDIQEFVQRAIAGEDHRKYKINLPPIGRPVRIYADGVYDLFHFGHALQLRQAKLAFPSVYLLVGVNSDQQVKEHKARSVMTHAERCEAVRHCRWVDEVVSDAQWVIDEEFLKKYDIDYVAHDEDPYISAGHEDVYALVKRLGRFIPTRRTPGVSTSELLERIVRYYRQHDLDDKLVKMGHAELRMGEWKEDSESSES